KDLLKKQGEPNAYIVGREAGGALVVGVRYGSGTLHHKVEGERPVYWTGPSIGFDVGANAASTFVLVYNLYDSEELYKRFPAGEGQAYLVGGFHVSYLRMGDVVLIPVRSGAGLRLGINGGYMKFSKKQNWMPF
ncbi:MAG: EipA family protein, partial [Novosphingobium sp.]